MFMEGYNIQSSLVAPLGAHEDMLALAAHHHIVPTIEKFEFSERASRKRWIR
jgi:D-arabinose 1-dehydrogenase-like Zn-dependent alcohol dehydrogenase